MFKVMLALHLLTAVFAVGPLVHAATTASRGIRTSDAAAVAASSRMLRIYSYASVLVIIFGFALMSSKRKGKTVAEFDDTWIWLSVLLWLVALALVLAVVVPSLDKAKTLLGEQAAVGSLTARVAAAGGVVGLIFAAVVFLMVYRPGG